MTESLEDLYQRLEDARIAKERADRLINQIESEIAERLENLKECG